MEASKLEATWRSNPDSLVLALHEVLVDFGYGVSEDYVKTAIERFYAGDPATGAPSMFIHKWLREGMDD